MNNETKPHAHVRTPQTDEVLRRVGRNVVNFQQVEQLLKYLNAHAAIWAPAAQLQDRMSARADALQTKTMGDLKGRFVTDVLGPIQDDEPPDAVDEALIGLRSSIECDADALAQLDKELRALVAARNDLIHHFLPQWLRAVEGDSDSALAYLDAQYNEATQMADRLRNWAYTFREGKARMGAFMASPEGERLLELTFLQSSRLVTMLIDVAAQNCRPDGWMPLATAGQLIKGHAPSELEGLRARFGHPTLKAVLLAAELFDVADEPTPKGGMQAVYRPNARGKVHVLGAGDASAGAGANVVVPMVNANPASGGVVNQIDNP